MLDPLELESKAVVSHSKWVLGTKLWSSERAASALPRSHLSTPTNLSGLPRALYLTAVSILYSILELQDSLTFSLPLLSFLCRVTHHPFRSPFTLPFSSFPSSHLPLSFSFSSFSPPPFLLVLEIEHGVLGIVDGSQLLSHTPRPFSACVNVRLQVPPKQRPRIEDELEGHVEGGQTLSQIVCSHLFILTPSFILPSLNSICGRFKK